ncbi:MAG: ABC transporter permease [Pirellulaceae bacterium]
MSLFRIAWRSIQQRGLASILTAFSMALGVTLVVSVLSIHGIVSESFTKNRSLGYNMIVGAKGGRLQLTLNTVYYLSQPVENVPYDYYLEFLPLEQRRAQQQLARRPRPDLAREGEFAPYTEIAIPVCLGDYFGHFRVVGTTTAMFDDLVYDPQHGKKYEFADGRNFKHWDEEHGFFEAVLGATVAREMNVKVGQEIQFTHGDPEGSGHGRGFTVTGILKPTGMPNDRAVFVNMEGFYLMEGHAKPVKDDEEQADAGGTTDPDSGNSDSADSDSADSTPTDTAESADSAPTKGPQPLPLEEREVTAILVKTANPIFAIGMENTINEGPVAQAVPPFGEIAKLFENIVGPIQFVLLLLTAMICLVSGISILVSIYNSMNDRRRDIAVMRALGAGRSTVMTIILFESILLSLAGGAFGWLAGHTLNWLASGRIEQQTGVTLGFFDIVPAEALLIPALMLLAVLVGLLPALAAYRTDVSKSLNS